MVDSRDLLFQRAAAVQSSCLSVDLVITVSVCMYVCFLSLVAFHFLGLPRTLNCFARRSYPLNCSDALASQYQVFPLAVHWMWFCSISSFVFEAVFSAMAHHDLSMHCLCVVENLSATPYPVKLF